MATLVDSNPFQPDVPEAIRRLDPDLYVYMQEQAEALRRSYAQIQALQGKLDSAQLATDDEFSQLRRDQLIIATDLFANLDGFKTTIERGDGIITLTRQLRAFKKDADYTLTAISQRIGRVTEDSATIGEVESIQAVANFYSLANMAADDARNFAARGVVTAQASARSERMAKVYRTESGFYAEVSQKESLQAQVSQQASETSAQASFESETNAKASMDAAGVSAEASRLSALEAETKAGESGSSARASEASAARSQTSADGSATSAEASRLSSVAAESSRKASETASQASVTASDSAKTSADNSATSAEASRLSSVNAESSNRAAKTSADASLASSQTAKTQADAAGASATTARTEADRSTTQAGNSSASATQSYNAQTAAETARDGSVNAASTSRGYRDESQTFAGQSSASATNSRDSATSANNASASASESSRLSAVYRDQSLGYRDDSQAILTENRRVSASQDGKLQVYWGIVGQAGNNRAAIELRLSNNVGDYQGFDITGNVRIYGNLLVSGTVSWTQLNFPSLSAIASSAWSGNIQTGGLGSNQQVLPFGAQMSQINPSGYITYIVTIGITKLYSDTYTTLNGKPFSNQYLDDGGVVIQLAVGGNTYYALQQSSSINEQSFVMIVTTPTAIVPALQAFLVRGTYDTGLVDDGDNYYRVQSQGYALNYLSATVRWSAI